MSRGADRLAYFTPGQHVDDLVGIKAHAENHIGSVYFGSSDALFFFRNAAYVWAVFTYRECDRLLLLYFESQTQRKKSKNPAACV